MVHGDCSSRGCYSMTDEQIAEIYALGRESFFGGQRSFQVQAYPFRMTAENIAKHRNNPNIGVLADAQGGQRPFRGHAARSRRSTSATSATCSTPQSPQRTRRCRSALPRKCPAYEVPEEIASLVRDKEQQQDEHADRRSEPPQHRDRADQDQRRRRHASGVRRSREEEPDRRRAAGTTLPGRRRRPEPFRRRCGRRASPSSPSCASWSPAPAGRQRVAGARSRRTADGASADDRSPTAPAGRASRAGEHACSAACSRSKPRRSQDRRRRQRWRAVDRTARLVGLRGSDSRSTDAQAATPQPAPKPKPRGQADQRRLAWRDPRRAGRGPAGQDHRSASSGAGRCAPHDRRRRAGQHGDERRRAGRADRQLRQPLVGLPLSDHASETKTPGICPALLFRGCRRALSEPPVAVLVFLARAARARLVAADLAPARRIVRIALGAGSAVAVAGAAPGASDASASANSSSPVDGSTWCACM